MNRKTITFLIGAYMMMLVSNGAIAGTGVNDQSIKNMRYHPVIWNSADHIEKRSLQVRNGEYERIGKRNAHDMESLRAGYAVFGDLNGDGKKDAAVTLNHNTGGSGTVMQIATVVDMNSVPTHVASRNLGDRTEVTKMWIQNGKIYAHISNERFYPGQAKTVSYFLKNGRLVGPDPWK